MVEFLFILGMWPIYVEMLNASLICVAFDRVISRVSSRTLTYGGGSNPSLLKPTLKKPAQTRKIHVYGFYNEDGSLMSGQ